MKEGWKIWRFEDMAYEVKERTQNPSESGYDRYVGLKHLDTDSLKIWRWGSTSDVEKQKLLFKSGDIIFGRRNAYLRRVAVADFDGVCSAHAMVLRAHEGVALTEFLPYFMQTGSFWEAALKVSAGSMSPTINWSNLSKQEFALPPLDEQRRIGRVLNASVEFGNDLQRCHTSALLLRQSLINESTGGDGQVAYLGDVCEMQNGRPFPSKAYQNDGVRLLRPGNLGTFGYLDWTYSATTCLSQQYEKEAFNYIIESGDIVINLTAQSLEDGFMGRACLAREDDHCLLNQRIGRLLFTTDSVCSEYVFRSLQSSRYQNHAIAMCEGTKVKHLYWRHLERFHLKLPSESVQKQVVESVRQMDETIKALERRIENHVTLHSLLINSQLS